MQNKNYKENIEAMLPQLFLCTSGRKKGLPALSTQEACQQQYSYTEGGRIVDKYIGPISYAELLSDRKARWTLIGIQNAIREKYAEVSGTAANKSSYPTGKDGQAGTQAGTRD